MTVQDAYAAAVARDTLQGYQDFVLAFPADPLAKRVRAIIAARREAVIWHRTYLADTPQAYWTYLRRYPEGPHSWDCRRQLTFLSAALVPPPSFALVDYDIPPPPPDELVIVTSSDLFQGSVFAFVPPPPPPVFFLPPPPRDFGCWRRLSPRSDCSSSAAAVHRRCRPSSSPPLCRAAAGTSSSRTFTTRPSSTT
jgi:hypothetical protein